MSINSNFQYTQDASGCIRILCATIAEPRTYQPGRASTCETCADLTSARAVITQKRIQRTVRVSGSAYIDSLAPQHVRDPALDLAPIPWNQASDRAAAGVVVHNVPSRGASSTHCTVTRARPGACSAPGKGVDIKHGSYDRYLAKLKGRTVARTCAAIVPPTPLHGNKTQYYSIASAHSCVGGGGGIIYG
jgi:hypothetical protein